MTKAVRLFSTFGHSFRTKGRVMPEILLPVCQHRPVPKTIGKRESSFDGDRLDQVPAVGIEVFEDGNDAIRIWPRFLDEADTPLRVGKVVTGKIICFEK
ncbi:hypothetical protein MC45_00300 [Sphingomonas taxi]|uniref:Uncharacterized protein n=1 Tax=Sphingomonas taxi TaxID=1549858 RepID=A0A097EC69_9SPHN|nr:hypothetical protein MC45_00300 [Sphingomonas taxi]